MTPEYVYAGEINCATEGAWAILYIRLPPPGIAEVQEAREDTAVLYLEANVSWLYVTMGNPLLVQ